MDPSSYFDVVILGGGPAGSATALALLQLGISRTLVVEAGYYDALRVGESVPPDVCVPLVQLGVWPDFRTENHATCPGSCSTWGSDQLGYNDYLCNSLGDGWHLDRRRFDAFLARTVLARGAAMLTGVSFEGHERMAGGRLLLRLVGTNREATSVAARFVVDATGLRSRFAQRQGARKRFVDRLVCAAGFFECASAESFPGLTMLEAVEYGWWYAAKLPGRRLILLLASDPDILRRRGLSQRNEWLDHLANAKHISAALADSHFVEDSLIMCPAPSFWLDDAAGNDWLAVGDAAAAYDPISSRGIYKALSDGLHAAPAISNCLAGDRTGLDRYRSSIKTQYRNYLTDRSFFYNLEQRWPASLFWSRRHENRSSEPDFVEGRV